MSGPVVAVYSLKGGVGKTTLAVNLAWASAALSARRTLLWDLDAQGAATYTLGAEPGKGKALELAIMRSGDPARLIKPTAVEGLDLLAADPSLRALEATFRDLDKKKRLAKVTADLAAPYHCLIIDCPPGLTDTSEQILRAADLVVVPVIPSELSRRALAELEAHISQNKGLKTPLMPVFSMVDRRRALHRAALAAEPSWSAIPMASAFEAMTQRRAPLGVFARKMSPALQAVIGLWRRIDAELLARE